MICAPVSVSGFSSTGFMCTLGGSLAARACSACARPISPPSTVTAALFDMFCGLNGRDAQASPGKRAAQAGDQHRLADIGAGALDHDGAVRGGSCEFEIERGGRFQQGRASGGDEHDRLHGLRHPLIEASLGVTKKPAERRRGNDSLADFIRNQNERTCGGCDRLDESVGLMLRVLPGQ